MLIFSENFAPPFPEKEVKDCEPSTATPVGGSSMESPSGTFALKLGILAASVTASIVLISACQKSSVLVNEDHPILIIFMPPGANVAKHTEAEVRTAFQNLGQAMCNVDYYDKNQVKKWHEGNLHLTMTGAVRSEASGNQASVDPVNVTQKAVFGTLDQATDFLGQIK